MDPRVNGAVLRFLAHRGIPGLRDSLIGLEVCGRRTGKRYRFPVQAAPAGNGSLVVLPGHHETKTWWRNLGTDPTSVKVLVDGDWVDGSAVRLCQGDPGYAESAAAYRRRWQRVRIPDDQPLVVVEVNDAEG